MCIIIRIHVYDICGVVCTQLLKLGFADDLSQNEISTLIRRIVDLRNPAKITRGLSTPAPATQTEPETSPFLQVAPSIAQRKPSKNKGMYLTYI